MRRGVREDAGECNTCMSHDRRVEERSLWADLAGQVATGTSREEAGQSNVDPAIQC